MAWSFTLQQAHQRVDLQPWPLPVFLRKRVERQIFHPGLAAAFHALADGLGAFLVAEDAGQPPLFGPTPVAIENDGDMPGNG
jgi:hypothetical protein